MVPTTLAALTATSALVSDRTAAGPGGLHRLGAGVLGDPGGRSGRQSPARPLAAVARRGVVGPWLLRRVPLEAGQVRTVRSLLSVVRDLVLLTILRPGPRGSVASPRLACRAGGDRILRARRGYTVLTLAVAVIFAGPLRRAGRPAGHHLDGTTVLELGVSALHGGERVGFGYADPDRRAAPALVGEAGGAVGDYIAVLFFAFAFGRWPDLTALVSSRCSGCWRSSW